MPPGVLRCRAPSGWTPLGLAQFSWSGCMSCMWVWSGVLSTCTRDSSCWGWQPWQWQCLTTDGQPAAVEARLVTMGSGCVLSPLTCPTLKRMRQFLALSGLFGSRPPPVRPRRAHRSCGMCSLLFRHCFTFVGSLLPLLCCCCCCPQPCCAPTKPGQVEVETADAAKHVQQLPTQEHTRQHLVATVRAAGSLSCHKRDLVGCALWRMYDKHTCIIPCTLSLLFQKLWCWMICLLVHMLSGLQSGSAGQQHGQHTAGHCSSC